jgi:hypothetical protein
MHRFIPALIKDAGYRLVEIPVNHRPRRFGQTKYGLGNRAVRATDRHVRCALAALATFELQDSGRELGAQRSRKRACQAMRCR